MKGKNEAAGVPSRVPPTIPVDQNPFPSFQCIGSNALSAQNHRESHEWKELSETANQERKSINFSTSSIISSVISSPSIGNSLHLHPRISHPTNQRTGKDSERTYQILCTPHPASFALSSFLTSSPSGYCLHLHPQINRPTQTSTANNKEKNRTYQTLSSLHPPIPSPPPSSRPNPPLSTHPQTSHSTTTHSNQPHLLSHTTEEAHSPILRRMRT